MRRFVDSRWGDIVALALIGAGGAILIWCPDAACRGFGERLSGAGLLGLRLTSLLPAQKGDSNAAPGGDVSEVRHAAGLL